MCHEAFPRALRAFDGGDGRLLCRPSRRFDRRLLLGGARRCGGHVGRPDARHVCRALGKSSVSRAEFCAVALKLYEAERETQVPRTDQVYFDDCDDPDVNTAYEMDLISGRGSGVFAPEESVSRQDLCVILDSVREKCEVEKPETTVSADFFPDGGELRDYCGGRDRDHALDRHHQGRGDLGLQRPRAGRRDRHPAGAAGHRDTRAGPDYGEPLFGYL